ncbi:MAG: hypothetical protein EOM63_01700 [Clostridia bacterium]|nr:hypothetical protein [Clostridia bacterium]
MDNALGHDCEKQEELYQFDRFTRGDALRLGLKLNENAQEYPDPVAIEITLNGLTVFRYFPEGTTADNALWLGRKRASVDLMQMSSLHFAAWLEANGETLETRKLDPRAYAACGGGFPILLRGTGAVGSICVSGLPHLDDHRLIVDTLAEFLSGR